MTQERKDYCEGKPNNLDQHIIKTLAGLDVSEGTHLYIGNGDGDTTIVEELRQKSLPVIFIAIDCGTDRIALLKDRGIESYNYQYANFSDITNFINDILGNRNLSSVSIINLLEFLPNPEELIKQLHETATIHNAPLIVSVPNITHKSVVFDLMEGEFACLEDNNKKQRPVSFFSHTRLERTMQSHGFISERNFDFTEEYPEEQFQNDSIFQSPCTTIHQYLSRIKNIANPFGDVKQFLRLYSPAKTPLSSPNSNKRDNRPFLTIVTRTQGKRPQALQEALLCLSAQTNTDFEVLVLGHRLTSNNQVIVEQCIEDLPDWFRQKVRLIKADDGNRTKPLHIGFMEAKGKYITILDDDDLVFDNWVEVFSDLANANPGTVLHAYAVTQDWKKLAFHGNEALQATGTPQPTYCNDFDFLRQLYVNGCPSMTYAIPSYVYQKLDIRFNLDLDTTEDWDFLMRSVFLCGISEERKTTSVYRCWENVDNSHQAHNQDRWNQNQERIINQMNQMPIVFPVGSVKKVIDIHAKSLAFLEEHEPTVFIDDGNGFSNDFLLNADNRISQLHTWYFTVEPDTWVYSIRIDPGDRGMIILLNLKIEIEEHGGDRHVIDTDTIKINGEKINSGIIFVEHDPQIVAVFPSKIKLSKIKVSYYTAVPNIYDLFESGMLLKPSRLRRLLSALRRYGLIVVIKKILRKIIKK